MIRCEVAIFAAILSCISLPMLHAETHLFYVSPGGSDSNLGTEELPWKSLAKAASSAFAGDTVFLRGGEYGEKLTPANSGEPGLPITFKAFPREEPIIDGSSVPSEPWGGLVHVDGRKYLHFDGIQVKNAKKFGFFVLRSEHVIIEYCRSMDSQDSGIMAWDSSNILIAENEVERASLKGMGTGTQEGISVSNTDTFVIAGNHVHHGAMEGIDAKDGCGNGSIFGNQVHHQKAVGIYVDAWARHQYDIDLFNNICRENKIAGIAVASENGGLLERIKVHDNICYGNDGPGFVIAGWNSPTEQPPGHPMKDLQLYRNLSWRNERGFAIICLNKTWLEDTKLFNNVAFWNKGQGFGFWGDANAKPGVTAHDIELVNNTIVGNGLIDSWDAGGIQVFNISIRKLLIRNNIASANKRFTILLDSYIQPSEVVIDHNLIDGFRGLGEEHKGTLFVEGSPGFINAPKGDYRLTTRSPAIDKGSLEEAPDQDFSMVERPQGKGIDLGAYEFTSVQ